MLRLAQTLLAIFYLCAVSAQDVNAIEPTVLVKAIDFTAVEGQETAAVKVYREQVTDSALRVYLDYSGTVSTEDVESQPSFIDLEAGQIAQVVLINPLSDSFAEGTESLTISIRSDASYSISSARPAASIFVRDADYLGNGVVAPLDETLKLHSLPGANQTIYLNFLGGDYSHWRDGNWDYVEPYDKDGFPSTLSDEEKREIQIIWAAVAEDFLPFEINVTTEAPPAGALTKVSDTDPTWGTSLLIGYDPGYGFAWSGSPFWESFEYSGYASINKSSGGFWPLSTISSAASHEIGHTMDLDHDGGGGNGEYYQGHSAGGVWWSPIMGESNSNMHQWSKGEYPYASNTSQDDLAVITDARNGFGYRVDDHADTANYATPLTTLDDGFDSLFAEGIVERNTDIDWFQFQHSGGDLLLEVSPDPSWADPNLDIGAKLYDGNEQIVASSDRTGNLTAGFSLDLPAGTYYVSVEGVGNNEGLGYSDYGSLGKYTITSGLGQVAFYDPINERGNEPVSGTSQFSSVVISNLTAVDLGSNFGTSTGYWVLNWSMTDVINPARYISFSVTPGDDQDIVLDTLSVSFYAYGAATLHLRSSLDNFTSDVDQAALKSSTHNVVELDLSSVERFNSAVEFRIYMTGQSAYYYLTGSNYSFDSLGQGLKVSGRVLAALNIVDTDGDGVSDNNDAYPLVSLGGLTDTDGDGRPNNCQELVPSPCADTEMLSDDDDGDGVADNVDAFPLDSGETVDTDGDSVGNNSDTDDDGDDVPDTEDAYPLVSLGGLTDTDGDGRPNDCSERDPSPCLNTAMISDADDDNDGLSDIKEAQLGTNPLLVDTDGDGVNDAEDAFPLDPDRSDDPDPPEIGVFAYFDPYNESATTPIAGTSEFSSLNVSALTPVNLGAAGSFCCGQWPLWWVINDSLDLSIHFKVSIAPSDSTELVLDRVEGSFYAYEAANLIVRTSADSFGANIAEQQLVANRHNQVTLDLSALPRSSEAIEIRFYMTGERGYRYVTGGGFYDGLGKGLKIFGSVVSTDGDGDGISDDDDNCPSLSNPLQTDADGDSAGDACDDDDDNDGLTDVEEIQLGTDPLLADTDGDGLSDREEVIAGSNPLEQDSDGDTVLDASDNCPVTANTAQTNTDQDGEGDACDTDDDNDGLSDIEEAQLGTNPLLRDTDADGWSDKEEIEDGSDPLSSASQPEVGSGLPIWLLYQATQ